MGRPTDAQVIRALEDMMRDPQVLCPKCGETAKKRRHRPGYQCLQPDCVYFEKMVVGELEIRELKNHLVQAARNELFHWARGCQVSGKETKCLPPKPSGDPTSIVPVIDGEVWE